MANDKRLSSMPEAVVDFDLTQDPVDLKSKLKDGELKPGTTRDWRLKIPPKFDTKWCRPGTDITDPVVKTKNTSRDENSQRSFKSSHGSRPSSSMLAGSQLDPISLDSSDDEVVIVEERATEKGDSVRRPLGSSASARSIPPTRVALNADANALPKPRTNSPSNGAEDNTFQSTASSEFRPTYSDTTKPVPKATLATQSDINNRDKSTTSGLSSTTTKRQPSDTPSTQTKTPAQNASTNVSAPGIKSRSTIKDTPSKSSQAASIQPNASPAPSTTKLAVPKKAKDIPRTSIQTRVDITSCNTSLNHDDRPRVSPKQSRPAKSSQPKAAPPISSSISRFPIPNSPELIQPKPKNSTQHNDSEDSFISFSTPVPSSQTKVSVVSGVASASRTKNGPQSIQARTRRLQARTTPPRLNVVPTPKPNDPTNSTKAGSLSISKLSNGKGRSGNIVKNGDNHELKSSVEKADDPQTVVMPVEPKNTNPVQAAEALDDQDAVAPAISKPLKANDVHATKSTQAGKTSVDKAILRQAVSKPVSLTEMAGKPSLLTSDVSITQTRDTIVSDDNEMPKSYAAIPKPRKPSTNKTSPTVSAVHHRAAKEKASSASSAAAAVVVDQLSQLSVARTILGPFFDSPTAQTILKTGLEIGNVPEDGLRDLRQILEKHEICRTDIQEFKRQLGLADSKSQPLKAAVSLHTSPDGLSQSPSRAPATQENPPKPTNSTKGGSGSTVRAELGFASSQIHPPSISIDTEPSEAITTKQQQQYQPSDDTTPRPSPAIAKAPRIHLRKNADKNAIRIPRHPKRDQSREESIRPPRRNTVEMSARESADPVTSLVQLQPAEARESNEGTMRYRQLKAVPSLNVPGRPNSPHERYRAFSNDLLLHDSIELDADDVLGREILQYEAHHQVLSRQNLRDNNVAPPQPRKQSLKFSFSASSSSAWAKPLALQTQSVASAHLKQYHELKDVNKKLASGKTTYKCREVKLPVFSYHAPIRTNFKERNVKRSNNGGYFPGILDLDDAKLKKINKEIEEAYHVDEYRIRLRNGQALQRAKQISPYIERALQTLKWDINKMMRFLLEYQANVAWGPREVEFYITTKDGSLRQKWANLIRRLPDITTEEVNDANKICQTFFDNERVSMWYLVRHLYETVKTSQEENVPTRRIWSKYRCRICHTLHCQQHGELREALTASDIDESSNDENADSPIAGSDDEDPNAINHDIVVRPRVIGPPKGESMVYRWSNVPDQLSVPEADRDLGRLPAMDDHNDSSSNLSVDDFDEAVTPCGDMCFWIKENRIRHTEEPWSRNDRAELSLQLLGWGSSLKGPCYIAMAMSKPCSQVFVEMLHGTDGPPPTPSNSEPKKPLKAWYEITEPTLPNYREPFIPCSHKGSCAEAECSCYWQNVPCEKTCACYPCERMWRGCDCERKGDFCRTRACDCFRFCRECDEDLCGSCGADDVLNPLNRDQDLHSACRNVAIQKGVSKRTMRGTSEVSGFGFFAAEKIKAGEFIGEYLGAITTAEESARRGVLYHNGGALYEAITGSYRVIDGTSAGNKTRYMNNAHAAHVINVNMKLVICNSVVREAFYASRDIEPGEELFFDYLIKNDDPQIKGFKEKTETGQVGPISERVLGKVVKTKVNKKNKKSRKRADTGGVLTSVSGENLDAFHADSGSDDDAGLSSTDVDPMELDLGDVQVDDERDDDYASVGHVSGGEEEEEEEVGAPRLTRSGRRSRRTRHFDDAASESSPSREGMTTRRRSGRVGGPPLSRHESVESGDSGITTRGQKRKRQSSGLGQSFAMDSE